MKRYYYSNIERDTRKNKYYRKVVFTDPRMQLVLMTIPPNEEIGSEIHHDVTQFIRIEKGHGEFIIGKKVHKLEDGDSIIIPAGRRHNIKNTGKRSLHLYSIYTPPEHPRHRIQRVKPE